MKLNNRYYHTDYFENKIKPRNLLVFFFFFWGDNKKIKKLF